MSIQALNIDNVTVSNQINGIVFLIFAISSQYLKM